MSQHSFSIADEAGAAYRSDVNNALQALASQSSGASAPGTAYPYEWWADTTGGTLNQRNAANSAWIIRAPLSESIVSSRASNTVLAVGDYGRVVVATASFTQTFNAASTLTNWHCDYRIEAGVTIGFDPSGSENIDGATTKTVVGPAGGRIYCDGSGFKTVGLDAAPLASPTFTGLVTTAGQVAFPAAQNASAGANVLDDYEEGTWTPGIAFGGTATGITYAFQDGHYTKIGRQVSVTFIVTLSNKGSSTGSATLTGLPFASAGFSDGWASAVVWGSMTSTLVNVTVQKDSSSTTASIRGATAAAVNLSSLTETAFSNTSQLIGGFTYYV